MLFLIKTVKVIVIPILQRKNAVGQRLIINSVYIFLAFLFHYFLKFAIGVKMAGTFKPFIKLWGRSENKNVGLSILFDIEIAFC